MEDISRSDVQFDGERWAQGRKTKRTIWQLVPVEMSLRTAVGVIGGCSREDVDIVNKLRMCVVLDVSWGHSRANQWADCGKHDLQEAKKLEVG